MHLWLEMIGYLGSLLVAISLMMRSLLKLRLINLVGALTFVVYGLLIHAYPVAFMNALIVGIDLYYLFQMWRQQDYFSILEVSADSAYLQRFLAFHQAEIRRFVPPFHLPQREDLIVFFVLRNMVPAGVFIATPRNNAPDSADILLDFVIPGYRDLQIGRFVYEKNAAYFQARGIQKLFSAPGSANHPKYLRKMGFTHGYNGLYQRHLLLAE